LDKKLTQGDQGWQLLGSAVVYEVTSFWSAKLVNMESDVTLNFVVSCSPPFKKEGHADDFE
jgi:hypothetical protein